MACRLTVSLASGAPRGRCFRVPYSVSNLTVRRLHWAHERSADLLLVGSLPADSAEAALRAGARALRRPGLRAARRGDGAAAPPGWGYERGAPVRPHPGVEGRLRDGVADPARPPCLRGGRSCASATGVERAALGRVAADRRRDRRLSTCSGRLRDEGAIPAGLRLQVWLPFPTSAMNALRAASEGDYAIADRGFEELVGRELVRLLAGSRRPSWRSSGTRVRGARHRGRARLDLRRSVGAVRRSRGAPVARLIPEEVAVGYHLCYGTFPEWPMYEARDMELMVRDGQPRRGKPVGPDRLAAPRRTAVPAQRGRSLLPAARRPRRRGDARVFLGIVLPIDGLSGARGRRHATASKYLADFGVAMYCGFGRQQGQDGMETMLEHRRVVSELRACCAVITSVVCACLLEDLVSRSSSPRSNATCAGRSTSRWRSAAEASRVRRASTSATICCTAVTAGPSAGALGGMDPAGRRWPRSPSGSSSGRW